MSLLADKTHSIRTYSSLGGSMEDTPALARKYGISMIQGCWLGYGYIDNKNEVAALIKSANENPDVVKRVIVGNEVLLRGDLPVDKLINYIREVKRSVKQPVSYADVWSMYMKYPQLIKEVDFITIHILPPGKTNRFGRKRPSIWKKSSNKWKTKRGASARQVILIGDLAGLARAGNGAWPFRAWSTARFIRDMIRSSMARLHHNIVEAFDQPEKQMEGVVGANWTLSADRKPVFPLTGPVLENPDWSIHFGAAIALWLLIVVAAFKNLLDYSPTRTLVFLGLAQIFSICLIELADFLWYTSYSPLQRAYTIFIVAANAGLGTLLLRRYQHMLSGDMDAEGLAKWLRRAYLFFVLLALYKTYGLAVNGRYLSFPIEQFALPVCGIIGLVICQWLRQGRLTTEFLNFTSLSGGTVHASHDRLFAYFLSFAAVAMIVGETYAFMLGRDFIQAHPSLAEGLPIALGYTLYNQQLVSWLGCLLLLSVPFWSKTATINP